MRPTWTATIVTLDGDVMDLELPVNMNPDAVMAATHRPHTGVVWFTPQDVGVVIDATVSGGHPDAKAALLAMPDAVADAAARFVRQYGLVRQDGQLTRLTRRGRRYLRTYDS